MAGFGRKVLASVTRRHALIMALVVAWGVVIGIGTGGAAGEESWLGVPSLIDILVVIVAVWSSVGLVLIVLMLLSMRKKGKADLPPKKSMWPSLVVMGIVLLIALRFPDAGSDDDDVAPTSPAEEVTADGPSTTAVVGQIELAGLGAVCALAIAAIIWSRRRLYLFDNDEIDELPVEDLAPIVDAAAHRITLGSDARSAVLGAYASLEESLAELGFDRHRHETPSEHISRVLRRTGIGDAPLVRLAELYEVARFSRRELGPQDRQQAVAALAEVQDELGRVAARPMGEVD